MPLWVINSNIFSNYFVTDENIRRTIKKCRDLFKNRVLMMQLQPGCNFRSYSLYSPALRENPEDWGDYNHLNSQFPAPR